MTYHDVVDRTHSERKPADLNRGQGPVPLRGGIVAGGAAREGRDHTTGRALRTFPASAARANMTQPYAVLKPVARIHQRGASPTQSGRGGEMIWLLTFEPRHPPEVEPLMGWTSSRDTLQQVSLRFASADAAVDFAERCGLLYVVEPPHPRVIRPKRYVDNFRHDRTSSGSP